MGDPLRFFVSPESLTGDRIVVTGDPYHHLRHVLRSKPGSIMLLLDGQGLCCEVRLEEYQPEQAIAQVLKRWRTCNTALPITLMQALPKGDKFDLILQKGTELGISVFQPLATEHAVPELRGARLDKRQQRWQRIVNEAARQSRRCWLPRVDPLQQLACVSDVPAGHLKLVLWEAAVTALAQALPETPPLGAALLIGPEGGFSATEIKSVTAAGFQAVHLGPRILRTETAGLAATSVLQYLYGDWRQSPETRKPISRRSFT